jgi:hypothetical protein
MSALSTHRIGKKLRIKSVKDDACHGYVSKKNLRGEVGVLQPKNDSQVFTQYADVDGLRRCEEDCSIELSQSN